MAASMSTRAEDDIIDPGAVEVVSVQEKKMQICMCHMCECGMHKCPAKHTSSLVHYPVDMGSEYTRTYQAWPQPQQERRPRPSPWRGTEEKSQAFVGVTTHRVDYCPKKLPQQRHVVRSLGEKTLDHCIPEGDYSRVSTEYKEHYKQKPLQSRLPPKKPAKKADGSGHFDGTTTHQTDFRRWPIRARAPVKPAAAVCCIDGDNNLDDTTTYKVAYWDKSRAGPSMRKKAGAATTSSSHAPFYSETTHHADYGPKPIPNRASPVKHEKDSLANPHAKFCGETTYHDTYKAWQVRLPRRSGEVLKSNLAPVDTKFSGESLYHTDFKAPKLPKRCPALLRARPQQIVGDHFVY